MLGDYLLMKTRTLLTQIFLETWTTRLIFLRCFPLNCLCLLQSLPIIRVWRMTAVVEGTRLLKVSKRTHISGSAYPADSGFGSKGREMKVRFWDVARGSPCLSGSGPQCRPGLSRDPTLGACARATWGGNSRPQAHCSLPLRSRDSGWRPHEPKAAAFPWTRLCRRHRFIPRMTTFIFSQESSGVNVIILV